jgi:hypothetical protein
MRSGIMRRNKNKKSGKRETVKAWRKNMYIYNQIDYF